jgi:hypothetical protein
MADEITPPQEPVPPPTSAEPHALPHLGVEYGTASKNLPPVKIVLISLAVVVVFAGIFAILQRPQSSATGTIDNVSAVEIPNQNATMVAVSITIHNSGQKPFWIHTLQADADTANGMQTDQAASASDVDRYFQAFPALKENSYAPLKREGMIGPGVEEKGTMIFSFPISPDVFNARKSLKITVQPYDQPVPLVLTK